MVVLVLNILISMISTVNRSPDQSRQSGNMDGEKHQYDVVPCLK